MRALLILRPLSLLLPAWVMMVTRCTQFAEFAPPFTAPCTLLHTYRDGMEPSYLGTDFDTFHNSHFWGKK